MPKKKVI